MNRVLELPTDYRLGEEQWREDLATLRSEVNPLLRKVNMEPLHAQDLQNCLCEFDKYERVRLGEGRPKQRYEGA
jgi:hypothetical protein